MMNKLKIVLCIIVLLVGLGWLATLVGFCQQGFIPESVEAQFARETYSLILVSFGTYVLILKGDN